MKKRIHRPRQQSAATVAKERTQRDKWQRDRPSLADLIASGKYSEPMSHGEYWDIFRTMEKLKSFRESSGLSLADITARVGIDRSALSRLENGATVNPTINTLYRYADALGKRLVVSFVDKNAPAG